MKELNDLVKESMQEVQQVEIKKIESEECKEEFKAIIAIVPVEKSLPADIKDSVSENTETGATIELNELEDGVSDLSLIHI